MSAGIVLLIILQKRQSMNDSLGYNWPVQKGKAKEYLMSILNISAYRFISLTALPELQAQFRQFCRARPIKGSIMLSHEGINLMLAASPEVIAEFKQFIATFPPFSAMMYKTSVSDTIPFRRMFIKIKHRLTPLAVSLDAQHDKTGNHLPPHTLKQWLDAKKEFTLLDVRNDYEIEQGTFAGATSLGLKHFSDFAAAVAALPAAIRAQPIVTCCTGGIRCEKIVPFMQQQGFKEVYQLEGGILQYFHDCGDVHYDGACYVFDERVAIKKADTV